MVKMLGLINSYGEQENHRVIRPHTKTNRKNGNLLEGYNEALEELKNREPFYEILNEEYDESLPALKEQIDELVGEIKKLKRHKHDEKSGDVLIRI